MKFWLFLLAGFAFGTAVVAQEDIWSKTINNDGNGTWTVPAGQAQGEVFRGRRGSRRARVPREGRQGREPLGRAGQFAGQWRHQRRRRHHADVLRARRRARGGRQLADGASPGDVATLDLDDEHDLEDHRRVEELLRPPRRHRDACPRAACPSSSPRPNRSSSSARCSCSISARDTRPTSSRAVMARGRAIPAAARELCLAFPQVEEFESHGSPNYRARIGAKKGKVFAVWALNHHGDGHVALWLNTPAMEQSRLLRHAPCLQATLRRARAAGSPWSSTGAFPGNASASSFTWPT